METLRAAANFHAPSTRTRMVKVRPLIGLGSSGSPVISKVSVFETDANRLRILPSGHGAYALRTDVLMTTPCLVGRTERGGPQKGTG
jgi:hypothetical protein